MKYFVGCLGPLNDACQSSIIYIACVYTGYYHAIRLHTFLDSLLVVFKQKQRAPACPQALYFLFEVRRARVIKKEKPRGICWPPAQGGRSGGRRFFEKNEKKNQATSVYRLMQRVNPNWKGADLVRSLWILNPKSKVNPMPSKLPMFCSVNNFSSLSGYFSHLIIRVCSKTKRELSLSWI